jgi:16S rRNA (cytosine1402-N4)-methyltransferase
METIHTPVLLSETLESLNLRPDTTYVDGTLGGAGHASAVFEKLKGKVTIIGFDRDKGALTRAQARLQALGCKPTLFNESFRSIGKTLTENNCAPVDAILLDIGISSDQLDVSGRGFSFLRDEPLLMTMEFPVTKTTLTAKDLLNDASEEALANMIYAYGEERYARRIAKKIVEKRQVHPLMTTFDLVSCVDAAVPFSYKKGRIHPATKTFQAIRIAVNDELRALEEGIVGGFKTLAIGGRLSVITFHSLEDRIVKQAFRALEKEEKAKVLTKKPISASESESKVNPRARSAKLRTIEKLVA